VGIRALENNTTGSCNTAIGFCALYVNTTGGCNVAVGLSALRINSSGCFNVSVGNCALASLTTGLANTGIGGMTSGGICSPVFDITTQNDRIVMGSSAVTNAYVKVAWTVVSDARDKIVEGDVPHGLNFVNQLEPKAFHFKENRDSDTPNGPLRYGFMAQDVLALESGNGIIIDAEDPDKLRYNGEALVPVLVNAIQELSAKNEELEARIAQLENG
jgi:hypothetical protein